MTTLMVSLILSFLSPAVFAESRAVTLKRELSELKEKQYAILGRLESAVESCKRQHESYERTKKDVAGDKKMEVGMKLALSLSQPICRDDEIREELVDAQFQVQLKQTDLIEHYEHLVPRD
jgi:hypothetical protein